MNLSIGIVGLPNVGKSTLFQALTKKEVEVANYPFATIDPNVGIVKVPDERLDALTELFHSQNTIPAIVEFVDIAGLVKGANKGEGLGNQFLANIREVAAVCHVVRAFEKSDIHHVEQSVDPLRDIDTIATELILKDLETLEKRLGTIQRDVRAGDKDALRQHEALQELKEYFDKGISAREFLNEKPEAEPSIKDLQFLSAKPVVFLINTDQDEIPQELQKKIADMGASFAAMNVQDELEISQLGAAEAKELGMETRLPALITSAYELLGLITFFTAGEKESRAWTITRGMKAPQAAGEIHGDFEEKFIKANVIPWDKLIDAGGYAQALAKGWIRTEGKEYVVQDGDVLEIKHGA